MKVYIVTGGCRDDHHIIAVCKTPELAALRSTHREKFGKSAPDGEWTNLFSPLARSSFSSLAPG